VDDDHLFLSGAFPLRGFSSQGLFPLTFPFPFQAFVHAALILNPTNYAAWRILRLPEPDTMVMLHSTMVRMLLFSNVRNVSTFQQPKSRS
ncbi:MAG: hypothetical protein CMQ05_15060, partial [Gammaproteobacteria bacterium]|nr:hypothetical protein [Gammaproteobacteria bacterium]